MMGGNKIVKKRKSYMYTDVGKDVLLRLGKRKGNTRQEKALKRLEKIKEKRMSTKLKIQLSKMKQIPKVRSKLKLNKITRR